MPALKFTLLDGTFDIHRLAPGAAIPKAALSAPFFAIMRTVDELSIVAPSGLEIKGDKTEPGWAGLRVAGKLSFSQTGILAGISLFALSTFDTDYILVKEEKLPAAREALIAAGHKVVRPRAIPLFSLHLRLEFAENGGTEGGHFCVGNLDKILPEAPVAKTGAKAKAKRKK